MSSNPVNNRTMFQQFISLGKTQQFYWFLGHFFTIICFVLNLIDSVFSSSMKYYRFSLVNIILTYIIVIKQIHFKNRTSIKSLSFKKLLNDENCQYLFLSIWFYVVSFKLGKVSGSLYSFTIYSVFHFLNYFQNNILHYLPFNLQTQNLINNLITNFTTRFNQYALMLASNSEIFILMSLTLSSPLLLFKIFSQFIYILLHVMTMIIMIIFLKFRYTNNVFTKQILDQYDLKITQTLSTVPALHQFQPIYLNSKLSLVSFLNSLSIFKSTASKSQ